MELDEDKYCDNGDLLYAWSASFGPKIWDGGKVIFHYHIWKLDYFQPMDINYASCFHPFLGRGSHYRSYGLNLPF